MKTLLVTGATGFVGRNLLLSEIPKGSEILAPVRNPQKLRDQILLEGLDPARVTALPADPSKWGPIRPTHALLSAGVLFARSREEYFQTNVDWTLDVLDALPESTRTVLLSSQSAGGPTPHGAQARTEADADMPLTWYGHSKLALEKAIRQRHSHRRIHILRPPMILGPRDSATASLFKMAGGFVRPKPGLRRKEFSFLSVQDVLGAIESAWETDLRGPHYIAADHTITDRDLIETAARTVRSQGITLPLPLFLVKALSMIVDAVPALRNAAPSLTRDRAREIQPDRWVVDSSAFRKATGWTNREGLNDALEAAKNFLDRERSSSREK